MNFFRAVTLGLKRSAALLGISIPLASSALAGQVTIDRVEPPRLKPLPTSITGRVQPRPNGSLLRQWPGTYFETAFVGPAVYFRVGPGDVSLRVTADRAPPVPLVKPAPGTYRLSGLGSGKHRLRIDVASENQAGPTAFGGFLAPTGTSGLPIAHRARAIEFIGDSLTVGYGNTSATRQCTDDEVWATTDTTRGLAPLIARHYDADYQVNAISGRGIVRNYNGVAAPTLPEAYPFALFDKARPAFNPAWHPQLIVIALGANDFSTALNPGEKWASRDALRADYEATYIRFVEQLRTHNPHAFILLWSAERGDRETVNEVAKVADALRQHGDTRLASTSVRDLASTGCNFHPNVADDEKMAAALTAFLDEHARIWTTQPRTRVRFRKMGEKQ